MGPKPTTVSTNTPPHHPPSPPPPLVDAYFVAPQPPVACEVSTATDVLISDRRYAHLAAVQREKRDSNKYGLLSAILTRREDDMLMKICRSLCRVSGAEVVCYMYDGCVVRRDSDDAREAIRAELRSISTEIGVEAVFMPWRSPRFEEKSLPIALLFSGYASFAPDTEKVSKQARVTGACLFNAVRNATGRRRYALRGTVRSAPQTTTDRLGRRLRPTAAPCIR